MTEIDQLTDDELEKLRELAWKEYDRAHTEGDRKRALEFDELHEKLSAIIDSQ